MAETTTPQADLTSRELAHADSSSALTSGQSHTPGPWVAHQGWADSWIDLDADEHPNWCEVTGPSDLPPLSITGHFGMANARLIAAAPDLLEALKAMVDWANGAPSGYPGPEAAAALAKAGA